ncbi:hypothetical protein GN244_ATG07983 [Phytophthora infestans]|uniref:Uncharacterized protein n=1 Tax=Phytophthora infestans TaxID=4787 RepID=A0A833SSN8_PHYIN|nr:hypothetical protein GN244_ATG07983 [Phytophthora infestans]
MDDFLFHETDTFAFPLLDFDPDSALLTSAELVMNQTHLQQTQQIVPVSDSGLGQISNSSRNNSQQPTSRMSTDGGSTDTEMSIPPPASVEQQKQHPEMGAASSRMSTLLGFSTAAHSPLPSEQKLLAPRTSSTKSSVNATTPTSAAEPSPSTTLLPLPTSTTFPGGLPCQWPTSSQHSIPT